MYLKNSRNVSVNMLFLNVEVSKKVKVVASEE